MPHTKTSITLYNPTDGLLKYDLPSTNDEVFNRELMANTLEAIENKHYVYDDILKIQVSNLCEMDTIRELPANLYELKIHYTSINSIEIPANCREIRVLEIKDSNLNVFPNIEHLTHLHTLTLQNGHLDSFPSSFPPNIQCLNLTGNSFSATSRNLDKLPLNTQILFFGNNFHEKPDMPNHMITYGTQGKETRTITNLSVMRRLHRDQLQEYYRPLREINIGFVAAPEPKPDSIFNSSQTVHITSINKSVERSVKKVIEMTKSLYHPTAKDQLINEFIEALYPKDKEDSFIMRKLKKLRDMVTFSHEKTARETMKDYVRDWTNLTTVQGQTNMTYGAMFARVWLLVNGHKQQEDFLVNIRIELEASHGMCFTGKFNRLINSLVGFVDGITVGISSREQLQIEIGKLVEKLSQKLISYDDCKQEVKDLFDDPELQGDETITEDYKLSWLDALEDYKPVPKEEEAMKLGFREDFSNPIHENGEETAE
jgi:hypothetical protein